MHPAALLLFLLRLASLLHALRLAAASFPSNETTDVAGGNATCVPAKCGNLTVDYPFSLGGVQPLECGYPVFDLSCDAAAGHAYLSRTIRERLFRVHDIFYDNRSLVVAVEATSTFDERCVVPDFNVSSGLALFPLNISATTNKNLTFVYNCDVPSTVRLPQPCSNRTMGAYFPEDRDAPKVPPNCSSVTVPVRAFQEAKRPALNYEAMIKDGFLLEWPTLGECDECRQQGGQCRFVELSFHCHCPGGVPCSTRPTRRGSRGALAIKIGAGLAAALLCLIILGAFSRVTLQKRRNRKRSASLAGLIREGSSPLASLKKDFSMTGSPRTHIFTYEELDEATDGFSENTNTHIFKKRSCGEHHQVGSTCFSPQNGT